jgi:hypothetical protein
VRLLLAIMAVGGNLPMRSGNHENMVKLVFSVIYLPSDSHFPSYSSTETAPILKP